MLHLSSTPRSITTKAVVAGVTALAAATLLAGCATGSSGSSSTGTPSASSASSQKVPANFPKSVPLVDGDVIVARGDADNGWSATISPDSKGGFTRAANAL